MPRVRFPLVDVVVGVGETPTLGAPVLEPHGLFISLWNDEACTSPADVTSDVEGTNPITGVVIQSTRIPPFWLPDGTVQIWGRVDAYNEVLLFLPTDPAAGSRDAAAASATAAQTARTGAETARTGAETARTGAETARTGAEAARDAAAASAGTAATAGATAGASAGATAGTTAATSYVAGQKGAAGGLAPLDGSSKLPDANVPDRLSLTTLSSEFAGRWQATHAYLSGDLVLAPDGTIIQRNTDGTSRSTYDTTEQAAWTVKTSGASSGGGLSDVATTATSNGALVVGKHNPFDATSGNLIASLADATGAGKMVSLSKKDATANTVTVSVAHLRDGGAGTIVLTGQYEALLLVSKADQSWWPVGDHKTKAYLDATYMHNTKAAVIGTGVHAGDLQGTPNLPDIDVSGTGTTLAAGSTSNVAANGVYFAPDPATARPTDGSPPVRFGARASLDGGCTVTFTNVVGDLVTSTLLPGEVRTWRQATDLGFGIEDAGIPLAQLDSRYSTLLVYNTGVYPARPPLNVPYIYIGPASVAPPDAQEGDLWFFETGI